MRTPPDPSTRSAVRDGRPVVVALATVLGALLFVLARLVVAADGDVSRFVVAGSMWTDPSASIAVAPGPGYDGQFAYRMAVEPTALDGSAAGVRFDAPLRLQRLTYPVLAHVVALGRPGLVPYSLVAVNVAALALLALLAAALARSAGRSGWAGLLVAGYAGFATSVGRDLTEVTTACLLLAALVAWRSGQHAWAVAAATGAVLSRETALVLVGAFAAGELVARRRDGRGVRVAGVLAGLVPLVAFAAWQLVCAAAVGELPLTSSGGKNAVLPGSALVPAVGDWVTGAVALERADLITLGQAVALAVTVVLAGTALRSVPLAERAAWVAALVVVLSLSEQVWRGPADFRTSTELHLLSAVVLLRSGRRVVVPGALVAAAGLMTAMFRVTSL